MDSTTTTTTTTNPIRHFNDDSSSGENWFIDTLLSMLAGKMSHYNNDDTESNNSREVTIVASTICVFLLLVISLCVACVVRRSLVKNKLKTNFNSLFPFSKPETIQTIAIPGPSGTCKPPVISSVSSCSDDSFKSGIFDHFFNKKTKMSTSDHNGAGNNKSTRSPKLQPHKNIITPDKNIAFVVPTVPLNVQAQTEPMSTNSEPSSSLHRSNKSRNSREARLTAEQYYPQLVQPEDRNPKLGFGLLYEVLNETLYVRLLGGHNISNDVCHNVVIKIYPGRGAKQKSDTFKDSFPVYNQEFSFHVRKSVLCTKILKLKVVLQTSPKSVLGCINLAFKDVPGFLSPQSEVTEDLKTSQIWKRLDQPSDLSEGVKLHVSLKWSEEPEPGLLTLKIHEASGLHENTENEYTSTYVKVVLQEQGNNIKCRKTRLIRWGSVPIFDDVFVVTIPENLLSQISFTLTIVARGRLGSKVILGKTSIGPILYSSSPGESSSSGTSIWEDMCHQPNTEVSRWLHLFYLDRHISSLTN